MKKTVNEVNLESQIFEMPNKVLVTEITYNNGLLSRMVTGIPKGINTFEIELALKNSLSSQMNVLASQSTLFVKGENGLEKEFECERVFYNIENRAKPKSCECFYPTFGMA